MNSGEGSFARHQLRQGTPKYIAFFLFCNIDCKSFYELFADASFTLLVAFSCATLPNKDMTSCLENLRPCIAGGVVRSAMDDCPTLPELASELAGRVRRAKMKVDQTRL